MKKRSALIFGLLAAALALSMAVTGCSSGGGGDEDGGINFYVEITNGSGGDFSKIEVYTSDATEVPGVLLATIESEIVDSASADAVVVNLTPDAGGNVHVIAVGYTAGDPTHAEYSTWASNEGTSSDNPITITITEVIPEE